MGYQTLEAALTFPNEQNIIPPKKSLLITDTLTSRGDFLIHHFIVNQIKANKHVILIGLAEIFNHYQSIARKLGVNLNLANQKGYFSFIDGLTSLHSPIHHHSPITTSTTSTTTSITTSINNNTIIPTAILSPIDNNDDDDDHDTTDTSFLYTKETLYNFYSIIKNIIIKHYQNLSSSSSPSLDSNISNILLILDDLSVLIYSGFKVNDVLEFWRACRLLVSKYEGSIITLIHADDEYTNNNNNNNNNNNSNNNNNNNNSNNQYYNPHYEYLYIDQEILIKSLIYQSDYLLSLCGLGTGFSRDISGEITIARGPRNIEKWFRPSILHYKIMDNNVSFFAKGSYY
ncbi:hypothetical protein Glove_63g90 [Diversispora epigaea]|uniref:Elongator complex protein 6 n=1 Tax=Diversispora epigaea TaxID=1348612 RepID=A0A397JFU0_9GLOM|nr:hypothetical protein Glove_63g90 [Diversispora epigaea]